MPHLTSITLIFVSVLKIAAGASYVELTHTLVKDGNCSRYYISTNGDTYGFAGHFNNDGFIGFYSECADNSTLETTDSVNPQLYQAVYIDCDRLGEYNSVYAFDIADLKIPSYNNGGAIPVCGMFNKHPGQEYDQKAEKTYQCRHIEGKQRYYKKRAMGIYHDRKLIAILLMDELSTSDENYSRFAGPLRGIRTHKHHRSPEDVSSSIKMYLNLISERWLSPEHSYEVIASKYGESYSEDIVRNAVFETKRLYTPIKASVGGDKEFTVSYDKDKAAAPIVRAFWDYLSFKLNAGHADTRQHIIWNKMDQKEIRDLWEVEAAARLIV